MVAAVTGATGAIGIEICRKLADKQDAVVGIYKSGTERANALAREIGDAGRCFKSVRRDLLEPDGPMQAYDAVKQLAGAPTIIVLAAGAKLRSSALLARPDVVRSLLELNVVAQIELVRLALKDMIKARFGRVIVIGSRAGAVGLPGQAAYAASKAALTAWAQSVAGEVGHFGITVNVVSPGAMENADGTYSDDEQRAVVERIGCRRLGRTQDIAAAVEFLASAEAGYINGATLPVDGGARF